MCLDLVGLESTAKVISRDRRSVDRRPWRSNHGDFSVALPRVSDSYSSREAGVFKNHRQNETVPKPTRKTVPKRPFQSHRCVNAMLRSKRNAASTLRIDTTAHN
jgi:hypothetical protein